MGRFINRDTLQGLTTDPSSLNLYVYVQSNPIRYTDPSGHYKDISEDFFMTMRINGITAKKHRNDTLKNKVYWIAQMAGNGRPWDYKLKLGLQTKYNFFGKIRTGEQLGNIHFGYIARAIGWSDTFILAGAGGYQIWSRTSQLSWWRSWFDDPRDQAMIKEGFVWWKNNPV